MDINLSNDASTIHYIMLEAFSEYANDPQPSSALVETVDTVTADLQNGALALVGKIDGQPVATVRYTIQPTSIYFYRLSVIPNFQGKGYAKTILLALEQYAKQHNITEIQCKVRMSVPRNIYLYESIGYEVIAKEQTTNSLGATMCVVTMKKDLI